MPSDTKGTVKLKNGKAVISMGTMKEPGFRDCRLTAKVGGKTYSHHIKVGFSPEKLQPYTQLPSDFNEFWNKTKAEAAQFPLTYTKEYVKIAAKTAEPLDNVMKRGRVEAALTDEIYRMKL